jgi:LPXTG-motif cell wall-anchored protein
VKGIDSKNSTSVSLRYDLSEEELFTTLYYYNSTSDSWQNQSATLSEGLLLIDTNVSGIYLLTQENTSQETQNVSVEVLNTETEDNDTSSSTSLDSEESLNSGEETSEELSASSQENTSTSISNWILGGGFLLLLLVLAFFFMHKKKEHGDLSQELKAKSEESKKQEKQGESQVLTSYQQIYEHTKSYVLQYKEHYSKDQLFRALKDANVSEDIINKVFDEVYK